MILVELAVVAIKRFHNSGVVGLKKLQAGGDLLKAMPETNINKLPLARAMSDSRTSTSMRVASLSTVTCLSLYFPLLHANNLSEPTQLKRGAHPFPLPSCSVGARLCDFFNGAYCFDPGAGDSCCDDGSGK